MFENVTYEVILQRMLDRVSDKFDKREGSVIWDTHSPTAIEFQILYIELETILKEAYGDTASREFLVRRCMERGISPYPATHAVLKGVFVPSDIDVSGQRFNIGDINYTVIGKIADGEYQVQCETAGADGNRYLGAMTPMDYIKGLQTAELTEILIPGEDEEGTENLRQRYFSSFEKKAFGGNVQDYLEKTNAIAGVGGTKVTRVWNGDISPSDMIPDDSVKAWYEEVIGTLDNETAHWLSSVYMAAAGKKLTTGGTILLTIIDSDLNPASEALIETVQEIIDPEQNAGDGYGLAPIGHVVTVKSAEGVEIKVRTGLVFDAGYGWDSLRELINVVISDYLIELRQKWAESPYLVVRISQIERRLLDIEGIIDIQGTAINGLDGNLVLDKYQIPVFGGVEE